MSTSHTITDKTYRKLAILAGLERMSFAIFDTLAGKVEFVKQIDFSEITNCVKIEDYYQHVFSQHEILASNYDQVLVLHENNLNTFVPKSLFDAEFLPSYLQFNVKVFETDTFSFDEIRHTELNNVFVPFANINNFLLDHFQSFDFKHFSSILVEKLLLKTINIEQQQVFVHLRKNNFEIVVAQNQKLILFNSFEITNEKDFIYYILFVAEQLQLNTEIFELHLLGDINIDNDFYKIAYQYVRNVKLLDVVNLQEQVVNENDCLKHFVLLNA